MGKLIVAGVVVILALITLSTALFVVDETEQVVVTRFGDVQSTHRKPGLYFKFPFGVDSVTSYDKRLLRIDAPPSLVTQERLFLEAMEDILPSINKIIVSPEAESVLILGGAGGIVPVPVGPAAP